MKIVPVYNPAITIHTVAITSKPNSTLTIP